MDKSEIGFYPLSEHARIPTRGTPKSAGFDLYAAENAEIIGGAGNVIVKTDVSVRLPSGTYGRIAMRSGLAVSKHLSVSAGVIDCDYTGNIGVVVYCTKNNHIVNIKRGERFAQLVPELVSYASAVQLETNSSDTSHVGWGSTGKD